MTYSPRLILVPTDFSDNAQVALDVAVSLARMSGASLKLLHVYQLPQEPLTAGLALLPPDMMTTIERDYIAELDKLASPVAQAGVKVDRELEMGAADAEVLRVAASLKPDLIVMGTHGRTGLRHAVLGSVAERVVRRAPCPVLVVPARFHQEAPAAT